MPLRLLHKSQGYQVPSQHLRIYTGSGKSEQNIAVVKVKSSQTEESTAVSAGKNCGNIALVRNGDKVALVDGDDLKALQKSKKFVKSRPKDKDSAGSAEDTSTKKKNKRTK